MADAVWTLGCPQPGRMYKWGFHHCTLFFKGQTPSILCPRLFSFHGFQISFCCICLKFLNYLPKEQWHKLLCNFCSQNFHLLTFAMIFRNIFWKIWDTWWKYGQLTLVIEVFSNKCKKFLQENNMLWIKTSNVCFMRGWKRGC